MGPATPRKWLDAAGSRRLGKAHGQQKSEEPQPLASLAHHHREIAKGDQSQSYRKFLCTA